MVVDDSIVRGTTSRKLVRLLRACGRARGALPRRFAAGRRIRASTASTRPSRRELIGALKTVEEIRDYLGVDSLGYLSIEGLMRAAARTGVAFCRACFTGDYPVASRAPSRLPSNPERGV